MTNSQNKWTKRNKSRLESLDKMVVNPSLGIVSVYDQALKNIEKGIESVYRNYAKKSGLDVESLKRVLSGNEKKAFIKDLEVKMAKLGYKLGDLYKPGYIARLSILEAKKQQIYWEILQVAPKEVAINFHTYPNIIKSTYNSLNQDYVDLGIIESFSRIGDKYINNLINRKYVGVPYTDNIWNNVTDFADRFTTKLGGALLSGQSWEVLAREMRDEFQVPKYKAMRHIRTRVSFLINESNKETNEVAGFKKYEYYALMDGRTCEICRGLDGRVFRYDEAITGSNFPPMHPNCYCEHFALFDEETKFPRMRPLKQTRLNYDGTERGETPEDAPDVKDYASMDNLDIGKNKNNIEFGRISRDYKGEELQKEFDRFFKELPEDEKLRKTFEQTAEMMGWKK